MVTATRSNGWLRSWRGARNASEVIDRQGLPASDSRSAGSRAPAGPPPGRRGVRNRSAMSGCVRHTTSAGARGVPCRSSSPVTYVTSPGRPLPTPASPISTQQSANSATLRFRGSVRGRETPTSCDECTSSSGRGAGSRHQASAYPALRVLARLPNSRGFGSRRLRRAAAIFRAGQHEQARPGSNAGACRLGVPKRTVVTGSRRHTPHAGPRGVRRRPPVIGGLCQVLNQRRTCPQPVGGNARAARNRSHPPRGSARLRPPRTWTLDRPGRGARVWIPRPPPDLRGTAPAARNPAPDIRGTAPASRDPPPGSRSWPTAP